LSCPSVCRPGRASPSRRGARPDADPGGLPAGRNPPHRGGFRAEGDAHQRGEPRAGARAIPAKGRLTDRLPRIYNALERDLKAPLTDEQQGRIYAAEGERKQALKDLPAQAAAR
jgi:hypothetical protein